MPTPRCLCRGAHSKVCYKWGPPLQGTYSEVSKPRCSLQGAYSEMVYSKVLTLRCLHRDALLKVLLRATATHLRCLFQGCLLQGAYSEVLTQRRLLQGLLRAGTPIPKATYSGMHTPRCLFRRAYSKGAFTEGPTPRSASRSGHHFKVLTPKCRH